MYVFFSALVGLIALVWARLPGVSFFSSNSKFRCRKHRGRGLSVSSNTSAGLSWLSEDIDIIIMQEVKPGSAGEWFAVENSHCSSNVQVVLAGDVFELYGLNPEIRTKLLDARGYYSIRTGLGASSSLVGDVIVNGKNHGLWEIVG